MNEVERLAEARYVSLTTFRRDGTPVATPMWVARDGDELVLWTPTDSWKAKRLRRDPRVTLAPCTYQGHLLGPSVTGTAHLLGGGATEYVRRLLIRKYGLTARITIWGSLLRRGAEGTIGIAIRLDPIA